MAPSIGCRACCRRQQRRLLAETMLTDMIAAVVGSRLLAGVMIVTLDPHATTLGAEDRCTDRDRGSTRRTYRQRECRSPPSRG